MLSAAMMLEHCGLAQMGQRMREAVVATIAVDGVRTRDLGGSANTAAFTDAVAARIRRE